MVLYSLSCPHSNWKTKSETRTCSSTPIFFLWTGVILLIRSHDTMDVYTASQQEITNEAQSFSVWSTTFRQGGVCMFYTTKHGMRSSPYKLDYDTCAIFGMPQSACIVSAKKLYLLLHAFCLFVTFCANA